MGRLRYVPQARKAEDGRIDNHYQLTERSSATYPARTKRNVRESDGTALFSLQAELSGGSALTLSYAREAKKPVLHLHARRGPVARGPARGDQVLADQIREVNPQGRGCRPNSASGDAVTAASASLGSGARPMARIGNPSRPIDGANRRR